MIDEPPTPESLVAEERNYNGGAAFCQPNCRGSRPAVMYHRRHPVTVEKPVVGDVIKDEDVRWDGDATESSLKIVDS